MGPELITNGRNGEKWEVGREETGRLEGAGTRKENHHNDQPSFAWLSAVDRWSTAHNVLRLLGIWLGMSSLAPGVYLGQRHLFRFSCSIYSCEPQSRR